MKFTSSLLTFIIFIAVQHLQAQSSYSWTGSVSSDWATAGNWTPSGVPGTGHVVSIGSAANTPVLDSNRSLTSLTMSSGSVLDLNT